MTPALRSPPRRARTVRDRPPTSEVLRAMKIVDDYRRYRSVVYLVNTSVTSYHPQGISKAWVGDQENVWAFDLVRLPSECLTLFSFWLGREGYDEG